MHRPLVLLLLLAASIVAVEAQTMPPLKEVVEHYFENQSPPADRWQLKFEKRPDGIFVAFAQIGQGDIEARYPFYQKGRYLPIIKDTFISEITDRFQPQIADPKIAAQRYLQQLGYFLEQEFDRYPYFGYPGWYHDVVEWARQMPSMSDEDLHALARAHSQSALALLPEVGTYAVPSETFSFSSSTERMTASQAEVYLSRTQKAIATYRTLKNRNPEFMTPVGPVGTKLANEYMTGFLTLLQYADEQTARQLLDEVEYDEYLLVQARNFLNSCPKDAVLITYGDTDTYPLLYVQAQEAYRTDVIVANSSVLETVRYRNMICNGPLGAKPLAPFPELPKDEEKTHFWVQKSTTNEGQIPTSEFRNAVELALKTKLTEGIANFFLPNVSVIIPPPQGKDELLITDTTIETIRWEPFSDKYYLTPGRLFMWHIVDAHQWARPLCFLPTNHYSVFKPWEKHLAYNGLVFQLYPHTFVQNNYPFIKGFAPTAVTFWQEEMVVDSTTIITDNDKIPLYQVQLVAAIFMVDYLRENQEVDTAREILSRLPHQFPNAIRPWGTNWIFAAEKAKELELPDTQHLIISTIAENLRNGSLQNERQEALIWLENKVRALQH